MSARLHLIASILTGLGLTVLAIFLLTTTFVIPGGEALLTQGTTAVHRATSDGSDKEWTKEFQFIDVGHSLTLIEKTEETMWMGGVEPIVDRAQLVDVFRLINDYNLHRFVICDVFFEDETDHDDALQAELDRMRDVVIPYRVDPTTKRVLPLVVEAPSALAKYPPVADDLTETVVQIFGTGTTWGEGFYKFRAVQEDTMTTLPLYVHRQLHPEERATGPWRLNTYIPTPRIARDSLPVVGSLDQFWILLQNPQTARAALQDKVLIFGDFSRKTDEHATVLGPMPGALILANLYLSLREGDNVFSLVQFLFLWMVLSGFVWATLWIEIQRGDRLSSGQHYGWWSRAKRGYRQVKNFVADALENSFCLIVISIASYVLFGTHLPVLSLGLALAVVVELIRYRHALRAAPGRLIGAVPPLFRAVHQFLYPAGTRSS